jgi:Protein of unknown function (DUF2786)
MSTAEEKVVKLLTQAADRGATPAEAGAYKAKALELAARHGIMLPVARPVPLRIQTAWAPAPPGGPWPRPAQRPRRPRAPKQPRAPRPVADPVSRAWAVYDAAATRQAARAQVRAFPAAGTGASPLPRRPAPAPAPRPQPGQRPRTVTPEMIRQARQSWRTSRHDERTA